jgi:hypothetical protein
MDNTTEQAMSKAKHTPGPWFVPTHPGNPQTGVWAKGGDVFIATCSSASTSLEGNRANAKLIAAAPELLEALSDALEFVADQEDVRDGHDGQPVPNKAMSLASDIRAAIAKATGSAQ